MADKRIGLLLNEHPIAAHLVNNLVRLGNERHTTMKKLKAELNKADKDFDSRKDALFRELRDYMVEQNKQLPPDFADEKKYTIQILPPDAVLYYQDADGAGTITDLLTTILTGGPA